MYIDHSMLHAICHLGSSNLKLAVEPKRQIELLLFPPTHPGQEDPRWVSACSRVRAVATAVGSESRKVTGFCLNRWMQYDLPEVADPLLLTLRSSGSTEVIVPGAA